MQVPAGHEFMSSVKTLVDALKSRAAPDPAPAPLVTEDSVITILGSFWNAAVWFTKSYADADASTYRLAVKPDKASFQPNVDKWNTLFSDADQLLTGGRIEVREFDPLPSFEEVVSHIDNVGPPQETSDESDRELARAWESLHPESFDRDGMTFFRYDIDLIDVREGQTYLSTTYNDVEYRAIIGEPVGPPKGEKARGKTAVIQQPPTLPKESKKTPSSTKGGEVKDPLSMENPLRVKGEPKSKALSNDQREQLRSFFKLEKEPVPSDRWAALSSKDKATELKKRSIPKWATEVVLRDGRNLSRILAGEITKDTANSVPRSPKAALTKNSSAALEAWLQLKADFKGTPLLSKPQSGKEKAFFKRFTSLKAEYGEQACFPKPKDTPAIQGRGSPNGKSGSRKDGFGDFIDMARAFGEIAKALNGK